MNKYWIQLIGCFLFFVSACSKVDYTTVPEAAYLRVFNDLNYTLAMDTKDQKVPFLCMLINPELDADGMPLSANIVGDFLDKRDSYAPPYPSDIGNSTTVNNPEYPGKATVPVGPVLNGFDLSSWAQVPSGKMHIMFMYRPKNSIPFFELNNKLKKDVLIDTTIQLDAHEVYTLHVLQKDFVAKTNGILLRQENFHKLSLSDSLVYVNFYNLSAKGYWQADASLKSVEKTMGTFQQGIKDEMNVFLSLYRDQDAKKVTPYVEGYGGRYLGTVNRNNGSSEVSPYYSFPLWADRQADGIRTNIWEHFDFMVPGINPINNPYPISFTTNGSNWASLHCILNGQVFISGDQAGGFLPNVIVNVHSGVNNPQSFATVNSIEVVNGYVYLTTIQRKYAPPIY